MASVEYEKQTCGRCGGSGQYSFNQIDGSRCYGCGGSGKKLTKRGAAAKAYADELLEVRIEDMHDNHEGRKAKYNDIGIYQSRRITFSKIEERESSVSRKVGDTYVKDRAFAIFSRMEDGTYKERCTLGAGIKVRLIPTDEDIELIANYQANLTKAGKPSKRSMAK